MWALVLAAVLVALVVWMVKRGSAIFVLSVRDGQVLLVRGRVPSRVVHALADVCARSRVARATIWAVSEDGRARLRVSGVDEGTAQRLRNAFGVSPVAALYAAPVLDHRNLGQVLGIAWLAWMLRR